MHDVRAPLRVDHQPSLGTPLVFQLGEPEPRAMREIDHVHLILRRLDLLTLEVRGLREDLARPVPGPFRRFWAWLRRLFL